MAVNHQSKFWSDCGRFFERHDEYFESVLREKENLLPCLRHMSKLTREEKEEIQRDGCSTKEQAGKLIDKVKEDREETALLKQFLEWVCQNNPDLQRKWRNSQEEKQLLDMIGVRFQYCRQTRLEDFPPDNKAFRELEDEFQRSADNPFLPTWENFAAECGMQEFVGELRQHPRPFEAVLNRLKGTADVEKLLQIIGDLGLVALHEELQAIFNLSIPYKAKAQKRVPEPKNMIKMAEHADLLEELAHLLSTKWRTVVTYLGVHYNRQEAILASCNGQTKASAVKALNEWVDDMLYPRAEHLRYALEKGKKMPGILLLQRYFPDLGDSEKPIRA